VCVEFGADKGRINVLAKSQIEHMPLAGGFQKGDRVRSLVDSVSPHHLVKGDVGTVVGPCVNESDDKAERVRVDFGSGKGILDVLAKSQIEHVGHETLIKLFTISWILIAIVQMMNIQDITTNSTFVNVFATSMVLTTCTMVQTVDFGVRNRLSNSIVKCQTEHLGHVVLPMDVGESPVTATTEVTVKKKEETQLVAAIAASFVLNQASSHVVPRLKRWGDGLDAPGAGTRHFVPQGHEVTLEVDETISRFHIKVWAFCCPRASNYGGWSHESRYLIFSA